MYCTQCGFKNPDDAKFCRECGTSLVIKNDQKPSTIINEKSTTAIDTTSNQIEAPEQHEKSEKKTKKKMSLAEKIVLVILVITLPFWGSIKTSDLFNLRSSQKIEDPKPQVTPAPNTIYVDDYVIEITDAFIENNYLVVTYNFTNNSSSEAAFYLNINNTCWQNGVEISEVYYPRYDVNREQNNLKPGASTIIYKVFNIKDSTSEVELTFEPLFNFTSKYSSITIDISQLENVDYVEENSVTELCAADFLGLTIPEVYDLTDKGWVLSPNYYNGGRYLTHDKYHYTLLFDGGENPSFTETITCVMTSVYDVKVVNDIYVGQGVSEIIALEPNLEIEYSEIYDPCLSGLVNYNGREYFIIMRFDEYNKTYRGEVWWFLVNHDNETKHSFIK